MSWLFLGPILTGVVTGFPPKGSLKFSLSLKVSCDTSLRNGPSNAALLESFSSWHHQVRSYKLILKSKYFALESYQDSQHLSIFHFKGPATHSLSFISQVLLVCLLTWSPILDASGKTEEHPTSWRSQPAFRCSMIHKAYRVWSSAPGPGDVESRNEG